MQPLLQNKPAGISAAEEFKRKIRERAVARCRFKGQRNKEETKEETTATETKKKLKKLQLPKNHLQLWTNQVFSLKNLIKIP